MLQKNTKIIYHKKKKEKKLFKISNVFKNFAFEILEKKHDVRKKKLSIRFSSGSISILGIFLKKFLLSIGKETQIVASYNGRTQINSSDVVECNSINHFFKNADCIFFRKKFILNFYEKIMFGANVKTKFKNNRCLLTEFKKQFVSLPNFNTRLNFSRIKDRKKCYKYKKKRENPNL